MSPCSKQPRALAFLSHLNEGRRKAEADDEVSGHLPFDSPRIHAKHCSYHRFSSDPSAPRAGDQQAGEEVGGTRLYPSHPRREKETLGPTRELEGDLILRRCTLSQAQPKTRLLGRAAWPLPDTIGFSLASEGNPHWLSYSQLTMMYDQITAYIGTPVR
jgi:hypothetical protein